MPLTLTQRPQRIITGSQVSIYTAASSPTIYRFQREDHQADDAFTAVVESGTNPGFVVFRADGDVTAFYSAGDAVYIKTDDGIYSQAGTIIEPPSYNPGNTLTNIQLNIPYTVASGIGGYINNLTSLTNYRVRINIYDFETTSALITALDFRPDPTGLIITDIGGALSTQLDSANPFQGEQFIPPSRVQPGFSLKYYIDYQELYDGSITNPVSDLGNPQVAVHAALGINRSASPNMLDFVPISGTYTTKGPLSNDRFALTLDPWINVTTGGGSVDWVWLDLAGDPTSFQNGAASLVSVADSNSSLLAQSANDAIQEPAFYAQTDYELNLRFKNASADVMQMSFFDKDLGLPDTEENYLLTRIFDPETGQEYLSPIEIEGNLNTEWVELVLIYRPTRDVKNFAVKIVNKLGNNSLDFSFDMVAAVNPLPLWLTRFEGLKKWRNQAASISFIFSNLVAEANDTRNIEVYLDSANQIIEEFYPALSDDDRELVNQMNYQEDGNPSEIIPQNVERIFKGFGRVVPDYFDNPTFITPTTTWDLDIGEGEVWTDNNPLIIIQMQEGQTSQGVAPNENSSNADRWDPNRTYVFDLTFVVTGAAEIELFVQEWKTELIPVPNTFDKRFTVTDETEIEVINRIPIGTPDSLGETVTIKAFIPKRSTRARRIGFRARAVKDSPIVGSVTVQCNSFQATSHNHYLEPKEVTVLDQCTNPFYLTWDNEFGGLDYYMFDYNFAVRTNVRIGQRKFYNAQIEAQRLRLDEWQALDYLNHPGALVRENLIDIDLGKLDRTDRKLGINVYLLEIIGLIRGGGRRLGVIPIPTLQEADLNQDGALIFRGTIQTPEFFTNTL